MSAPHATDGPAGGYRAPRRSDVHAMICDAAHFHGVLAELGKLWLGVPLTLDTGLHLRRYGRSEWAHLDHRSQALHQYALNLSHGFLLGPYSQSGRA